jgi:hypothetical protein
VVDTIPTSVVPSVMHDGRSQSAISAEFRKWLGAGARLLPVGSARRRPRSLLGLGYTPRHRLDLFDTTFYLTNPRQNPDIRFFVAYVVPDARARARGEIHPRIFYKDLSLVWRSASHYVRSENENWIGKGEAKIVIVDGQEVLTSAEETTDLPLEIQTALEILNRAVRRVPRDERAVGLVLRRGGDDRIAPFRDFTGPRERARANRRNLIHGGRPIARFTRQNDPTSLRFVSGFQPDFTRGILESTQSKSSLYGGPLGRYRILSGNRKVQYLFIAGPKHAWVSPPQATTTEISSYGVRTIDALAPEDMCIPGFEYHFWDGASDPPEFVSQIPPGYAGEPSVHDPRRCDASPWLDRLPVIREFRRKVLAPAKRRRR